MLTLNFTGKRAGDTDLMDESREHRLFTSRTFIAGNIKTAIYKCVEDERGVPRGQFLARFHSHLFSSDELEIEGLGTVKTEDCISKEGKTLTFAIPAEETFIWKHEADEFLLCDLDHQEVVRVKQRTLSVQSSRRRRHTSMIVQDGSRNLDYVVVVCLCFLLLEERSSVFGGVLGESMNTFAHSWLAPGFGFGMS